MTVDIKIANDSESKEWDKLVDSSPHGTIFHTWKWLKIMEKHTESKLYPVIGLKGTTPIGIFPLFYQKKFLAKMVFSPPPQLAIPYLGPALVGYDKLKQDKKESIFIEFQKQVDDFIFSELKPNYVSISSSPGLLDSRPFKWIGYQLEPMYSYLIDLSKGADHVLEQFKRKLRNDISRARKRGFSIEAGSKKELGFIYDAIIVRYEEQSRMFSPSKKYLLDLYDSFYLQNLKIFVAKYNGAFIGGIVNIYYKDTILNWIGNARTNIEGVSPNDLLHWDAIKWAIEHDLKYYELIGANTERLCHYKSKYNPELQIYFQVKKATFLGKTAERLYLIFKKSEDPRGVQ